MKLKKIKREYLIRQSPRMNVSEVSIYMFRARK